MSTPGATDPEPAPSPPVPPASAPMAAPHSAPASVPRSPGFARRAASALRKAGRAVWRSGPAPVATPAAATDASRKVVSFAQLTDQLKTYLPSGEIARVKEAFRFADAAHLGQFRKSGDPYITHPVAVAEILARWRLDSVAVQAALLHDVMEDSGVSRQDLAEHFGPIVAELVDGVSKLDRLNFASNAQAQAESFRKMLLAMARDVRVILIKLADRLHNVRTLEAMDRARQTRIARESLEIYAPIAHRLGLNEIYRELQEACFARLFPWRQRVLEAAVHTARGNRREVLRKIQDAVQGTLARHKVKAEVYGREKTLFAIYRKMVEKRLSFSEVLDIYGFRVMVPTAADCYLALGALHSLYRPIPGKFKDYIAIPKVNGYQSLHTTLVGPFGQAVEFQIRTQAMNQVAESGVAAHWLYKDKEDEGASELQTRTHQWLQSLIEIQQQTGDSAEFLENVKVDLFPDKVYVFTPKGKIASLPRGATAVDFAYSIHTDIGNRCVAARVNGEVQPLRTELRNGDVVEIVAGPVARPNPAWLAFVRTGRARAEIRHFLRTMKREESVELGERLLAQALANYRLDPAGIDAATWAELLREAQARDRDELLADIGLGRRLAAILARQLHRISTRAIPGALPPGAGAEAAPGGAGSLAPAPPPVQVQGAEGMALQMAGCCSPIPGDEVVGQLRRDLGLLVHRSECAAAERARRADPERWLDLQWAEETVGVFGADIDVRALNDRGLLGRVAVAIGEAESNIARVSIEDDDSQDVTIHFRIQVRDRRHLAQVLRGIRRVRQVLRVVRGRLSART
jgi:guanosine-3',5'-bis(diphosphate) 3'-pyrophosphohydrolase